MILLTSCIHTNLFCCDCSVTALTTSYSPMGATQQFFSHFYLTVPMLLAFFIALIYNTSFDKHFYEWIFYVMREQKQIISYGKLFYIRRFRSLGSARFTSFSWLLDSDHVRWIRACLDWRVSEAKPKYHQFIIMLAQK